jgi:hypothetical protein
MDPGVATVEVWRVVPGAPVAQVAGRSDVTARAARTQIRPQGPTPALARAGGSIRATPVGNDDGESDNQDSASDDEEKATSPELGERPGRSPIVLLGSFGTGLVSFPSTP